MEDIGKEYIDDLTNLYNRRYLQEEVSRQLELCQNNNLYLSVLIIDIDHFKNINDSYGHTQGDMVLKEFGEFLRNSSRKSDILFRYGGDEFICLSTNTNYEQAKRFAQRFLENVRHRDFARIRLTLSIGIATFPDYGKDWETLFDVADRSLYNAKRRGRNQIGTIEYIKRKLVIPTPRIVGRDSEIFLVKNLINSLFDNRGVVLFIGGEPGIGKTRLVEEIIKEPDYQNFCKFVSNLSTATRSIPYYPFREIVASMIEKKGKSFINEIPPVYQKEIAKIVPEAFEGLESEKDIYNPDRFRLFEGLRRFFALYSLNNPLFLFIDNIHWADDSSLELLQYLCRTLKNRPIFFFLAYRSDEAKKNSAFQGLLQLMAREGIYELIMLKSLDFGVVDQLISFILDAKPPTGLTEFLYEATGGNPFFVEELIKSLENNNVLYVDREQWVFDNTKKISVPYSISAVLERKLGMLKEDSIKVLEKAAVIGRNFDFNFLKNVLEMNEGQLYDSLDEIIDSGFLTKRGESYYFSEDIIRDLIYNKIGDLKLKHYHQMIGDYLLKSYKDKIEEVVEELAYHFYLSGDGDKTVEYSMMAGDKSRDAYANQNAIRFYAWALEYLKEDNREKQKKRIECLRKKAELLSLIGENESALEDLKETIKISEKIADRKSEADCLVALSIVYKGISRYEDAMDRVLKALKIYEDLNDNNGKMVSYTEMGSIYWFLGKYSETFQYCENALKIAKDIGDRKTECRILVTIGNTFATHGDLIKAIRYYDEVLKIAKEISDIEMEGIIFNNLGVMYRDLGEYEQSLKYHQEALRIHRKVGNRKYEALNLTNIGTVYIKIGEHSEALNYLKEGLVIAREIQNRHAEIENLFRTGEVFLEKGEFDNAQKYSKEACEIAQAVKSKYYMILALFGLASVSMQKNELSDSENYLNEALSLAKELNSDDAVAEIMYLFGIFWTKKKDWVKAKESFESAISTFEEIKDLYASGKAYYYFGLMFREMGDEVNAIVHLKKARDNFEKIGARWWFEKVEKLANLPG